MSEYNMNLILKAAVLLLMPFLFSGCFLSGTEPQDNFGELWERVVWAYDGNGNQTQKIAYDANGTKLFSESIVYNQTGQRTRMADTVFGGGLLDYGDKGTREILFAYDGRGNLSEEIISEHYSWGSSSDTIAYKYDENDNLIEKVSGDSDYPDYIYEYDADGQLVEVRFHNGGGEYSTTAFVYDASGKLIEMGEVGENGVWRIRTSYAYDSRDRKVEELVYFGTSEEPSSRRVYAYDSNGRKTETRFADGFLSVKVVYDENGNKVEEERFGVDGSSRSKFVWVNEYDGNGNLIERSAYLRD